MSEPTPAHRRAPSEPSPFKRGLLRGLAYAVLGWLVAWYGVWLILWTVMRLSDDTRDPSLLFALIAVPVSSIGALVGAVRGYRARPA